MRRQMWTSAARPTIETRTRCCLAALMVSRMLPGSHVDSAANSTSTCSHGVGYVPAIHHAYQVRL